jgi:NADH-quinone oxidoreductase subunit E
MSGLTTLGNGVARKTSMLSREEIGEIEALIAEYPDPRAASIEALMVVQKHRRWVSDEALREVASMISMSADELEGVATFYNLIYRRPVGRHVILLCDSVSCYIVGYQRIRRALEEKLGIRYGQTTRDDRFTLLPIACLGACERGPALMIDEDTHFSVTPEKLDQILAAYP